MSQLYSAFKANVLARYNTGAQTASREDAAIQAVADYAKSQIVREVDADLPLRQSYLNSYREAKVRLAGYTITSNFATVLAAVKTRITVDGNRDGIAEASGYRPIRYAASSAGYKDWFEQEWRRPGFTVEAGKGVNPLPFGQFWEIWGENIGIMLAGLAV